MGLNMAFSFILFGPRHYFWRAFKGHLRWRAWFHRPAEHSTGGTGFCIPGLHVAVTWGRAKP